MCRNLCLLLAVVGLCAVSVSAANLNWTGTEADANGVGFWDAPANWSAGVLPTMADRADLNMSDATIVVDDWDPNVVKQANEVRVGWGTNNPDLGVSIGYADQ